MKTFTRWLLALLLVAMPMLAAVQSASANSELVPASRLVAPYVTNGTSTAEPVAGQSTFLLITRTSWTGGPSSTPSTVYAHIEFYDKSCSKTNRTIQLSQGDTDQFNIDSTITMTNGHGWADIDVRSGTGLSGDPSVQNNSLVGSVLVADTVDDYAFSYPMASSVGSAQGGGTTGASVIVNHDSSGNASAAAGGWTGRYEPFPNRLILPAYFAEGTDSFSRTVTGFLAVASPADGNWYGQGSETISPGGVTYSNSTCTTSTGCGESPGENLTGTGDLITSTVQVWDGCEDSQSQGLSGHYVSGTLSGSTVTGTFTAPGLFGSNLNRSAWASAPSGGCTSAGGSFPRKDEGGNSAAAGGPVGWLDFPNTATTKRGIAVTGTARIRGLVGVFFETSVGTGSAGQLADSTRLWGDRASINSQTGCSESSGRAFLLFPGVTSSRCTYNIINALGVPTSQQ